MNDNKQDDGHVDGTSSQPQPDDPPASETAASPVGSLTSRSSSSRQEQRVVELLPDNVNPPDDAWRIGLGFYDEDVLAIDHSADQDDDWSLDEGDEMNVVEPEGFDTDGDSLYDEDMIILGGRGDAESSDSDSYDEADFNQPVNYDLTLPVSHQYLGDNLEEATGRQYLVDNTMVTLPLINLRHVVLLPGQVLPLTTVNLNNRIHMYLKTCIESGISIIGLMSHPQENTVGTTAEIRNFSQQDEDLRIIMEGRQRFKLLSQPFETTVEGQVMILPEVTLGKPYNLPPSRARLLLNHSLNKDKIIVSKHPRWLLKQYETTYLVRRILDQIRNWCSVVTNDPNEFSYWVAANLSISNPERIKVLKFSCTEGRLLWMLRKLERSEYFGCSACRNVICHKKDVFPMSCTGPQNSFVNPHGYVHDTITVRVAKGLIQDQSWSDEYSWFPGYAWRVACCDNCQRHIGWCYKSQNDAAFPKRFFGLSRLNVRLQTGTEHINFEQALSPRVATPL